MNNLTFLDEELANGYGASDATLKAVLPGGRVVHISDNISPFKFLDTCPLMYHAFEYNSQSRLQASIEASSETAVISLARYCYTGSYLAGELDGESILLLEHAETYKIAEDFDVPELQIMAHGNFSCQIEYACCLPKPPKDLLDTVRFIYRHFASDEARRKHNLVDTLLNYCVAVYLYHKLGESLDFLTAVHEIPSFRQDLCRTNIARNFEDDYSSIAADTASEDEGFAMVHRSQAAAGATPHSPMSSPELVPTASIAQTMVDEKAASDDDWDML
ncbi:hypothetical protein BU25DRAFT_427064 [Macroventuria anomochaeta]|uniref:Uncharacterized protein n=1 Tax=Macroventuria anomochaeta TaxID=301207 RepID=A0ACB6SJD7_9PLEO|nr:uncharacterized protein BU25DRAFT_427064 [Macroventuria anomochaeta]KAF2633564.1 hypothetical protein BU25DRAFT_427064 [Macroventuria anomochaeta]